MNLFDVVQNPILFFFMGGDAFYFGILIVIVSNGMAAFTLNKMILRFVRLFSLLGFLSCLHSANSVPVWYHLVWGICLLAWNEWLIRKSIHDLKSRISAVSLIGLSISLFVWEVASWPTPIHPQTEYQTLYVLGDSITSGLLETQKNAWPKLLQKNHQIEVLDFSQTALDLKSSLTKANNILAQLEHETSKQLILIQLGAQDLLHDFPVSEFATHLEQLFHKLAFHQLIMLELPLSPFMNEFGRIQRQLASKYHVTLIPKRRLAEILCDPEATIDGIHLTKQGHQMMSSLIWGQVKHWLKPLATNTNEMIKIEI